MITRTLFADLTNRTLIGSTNSSFPVAVAPFYAGDVENIGFDSFFLNPVATTGPLYTEIPPGPNTSIALGVIGSAPIVSTTITYNTYTTPTSYYFPLDLSGTSASAALGTGNSATLTLETRIDGTTGFSSIQAQVTLKRRLNY